MYYRKSGHLIRKYNMGQTLTAILFLLISSVASGQNPRFHSVVEEGLLSFKMPENFDTVPVNPNRDMNYDLAIKSKTDSFEIRYAIRPLRKRIEHFEKMAADTSNGRKVFAQAHPNKSYQTVFVTVLHNTSLQPQAATTPAIPRFGAFKPEAVKNEFNADWGATSGYAPRTTFDSNYKNCMTVTLHKDDAADVYIFYLFNDKETMMRLMPSTFHAMKFK
ncbi:hypothetical protein U0035_16895 [Niabella yanshanensis]|uniref:Uncharacterized protein n=1 Tax=Niabella yanshanensis TaxID=577386 RepID=A0ABZ0W4A8_9BACT|nr:hypothetical protein [Niabella yanshanensis]WQD37347.1 hypothetical protein U0035_16895 [Niabella yanshanensis]